MAEKDKILFSQVKQGDRKAFDLLFREYYIQLCRFAYSYMHSQNHSEEVVQNVFIKLWENRQKTNISTSFISYLYTAVKNQALNDLKKDYVRKHYESEYVNGQDDYDQIEFSDSGNSKIKIALKNATEMLPPKCREIFELSRADGLTYDEIADYLNISEKTVENQMGIAFKKLREILMPQLSIILNT
jgi:RNA polymerase sigma-70 factor, ECF subfamily